MENATARFYGDGVRKMRQELNFSFTEWVLILNEFNFLIKLFRWVDSFLID